MIGLLPECRLLDKLTVVLILAVVGATHLHSLVHGDENISHLKTERHEVRPLANRRQTRQARQPDWYTGATQLANAVFAARGQTAIIPCVKSGGGSLVDAQYTWKNKKHQLPLADSRFVTKETGDLEISDIQPEDSGAYECHAKYRVDGEEKDTKHVHHLLEYMMPVFQEQAQFVYDVSQCSDAMSKGKEMHLQRRLCGGSQGACVYHFNSSCHSLRGQTEAGYSAKHEVWISISVSTDTNFKAPPCDATCMKKETLVNIKKNYAAVMSLADLEIFTTKGSKIFRFDAKKFTKRTVHKCTSGYRPYGNVVCLPCEPGSFSADGSTTLCNKCPVNKYQEKFAMTDCFQCPNNGTTDGEGTTGSEMCREAGILKLSIDMNALKSGKMQAGLIAGGILGAMAIATAVVLGLMWRNRNKSKKRREDHVTNPDFVELHNSIRQQKSSHNRMSKSSVGPKNMTSKGSIGLKSPLMSKHPSRVQGPDDDVPVYMSIGDIPSTMNKSGSRNIHQGTGRRNSSSYTRQSKLHANGSVPRFAAPPVPGMPPLPPPRPTDIFQRMHGDDVPGSSGASSPGYESIRSRDSSYEHPTYRHPPTSKDRSKEENRYTDVVRPLPHYSNNTVGNQRSAHAQSPHKSYLGGKDNFSSYEFPVLNPVPEVPHNKNSANVQASLTDDGFDTLVDVLKKRRKTLAPDTDDERELRGQSSASVARRVSSTSQNTARDRHDSNDNHAFSPYKPN